MNGRADAVVVGAGVIGMTTAIRLADAGMRVAVLTTLPPGETTSALATAMVGPSFGLAGPRGEAWTAATVAEVLDEERRGAPGVHVCRGLFAGRGAGEPPDFARGLPGFRACPPDELPPGFRSGFWLDVPLIDMPPYLEYLGERLAAAGVTVERVAPLSSLREATALAPRVANCSGLAARDLVPDPDVVPLRGPKIVVRNPGIDTFLIEGPPGPDRTSYHPHGDIVVLGGSVRESDDTTPDPAEADAILRRCAEAEPLLEDAEIIEHRVGLRPGRPSIRLEAEEIDGALCVHSYGHAGLGVTVSWGCAAEVAELLARA
ncbi:MAG TPA: FAD-dependent oxidoreductase [Acidimicrobiales bacterium]|nr:FAD-dependent oxidoreductase [Acidimicrobiales bacterium]